MKDIDYSFDQYAFIDLSGNKIADEQSDEEQILNTIQQTINIFSGIGYRLRPLIPTSNLAQDVFDNQFKYKLDRINFGDLLIQNKSYLAEEAIVKAVFNNCIFTIYPNSDVHYVINNLCKSVRNDQFDISRITHEYTNLWREGTRLFHFKFSVGEKSFIFDSVEERGILYELLVKFDEFLRQFKIGLYRIENTKDFIILADAELDVLLGLSWRLTRNYFDTPMKQNIAKD